MEQRIERFPCCTSFSHNVVKAARCHDNWENGGGGSFIIWKVLIVPHKGDPGKGVFVWIFRVFKKHLFYRTSPDDWVCALPWFYQRYYNRVLYIVSFVLCFTVSNANVLLTSAWLGCCQSNFNDFKMFIYKKLNHIVPAKFE